MLAYRLYLSIKQAADATEQPSYTPDSILMYPFRGRAPRDLNELADRRADLMFRTGAGGMLGAAAGGAAGHIFGRLAAKANQNPRLAPIATVAGLGIGAGLGSAVGTGYHKLQRLIQNADEHRAALKDYYAHGGHPLPFSAEHPYVTALGATVAAPVVGAAIGAGVAKSLGQDMTQGIVAGAGLQTLAGAVLNKQLNQQRRAALPHVVLRPGETASETFADQQMDMI